MKTKLLFLPFVLLFSLNAQTKINGRRAVTGSVNPQTSTYQVLASDFNSPCGVISVASGTFTVTLVASGSQPPAGQCVTIINYGIGVLTLARSGQNINGAASNIVGSAGTALSPTGWTVTSDGTNYIAAPIGGSGGVSITSGPIASRPGSPGNAGSMYYCTDSPYTYLSNGSTWDAYIFGYKVVEPVMANFTQVNVGLSTFDTTHGGILWSAGTAGGHNVQVLTQTAGIPASGAYYVDAAFIASFGAGNGAFGAGLAGGLLASSSFAFADWGGENNSQFGMAAKFYNTTTSYNGSGGFINMWPLAAPLAWFRMFDDRVTTRTYYYSNNGYQWYQIYSEPRTTLFTPAFGTVAITNFSTSAKLLLHFVHFSIHT